MVKLSPVSKTKETKNKEGMFVYTAIDKKKYKLTLQEKCFCEKYLEYGGNGTQSYYEIYKVKNFQVAAVCASRVLRKARIYYYIGALLEDAGFNQDNVKKQHAFIINQMDDLHAKNKAVDMFYKLEGKYAPDKHEVSFPIPILGSKPPKNVIPTSNGDEKDTGIDEED